MAGQPYIYDKSTSTRYTFVSKGKRGAILKVVEFTALTRENIINLGFGDLLLNGEIDDTANSNNGDISKVLATVIAIIKDFTNEYQESKIVFTGSTARRTAFYQRILKTYYDIFTEEFIITGLVETGKDSYEEMLFDKITSTKYLAFFVKRNK